MLKEVYEDATARIGLLLLLNACFADGVIPRCWGESELFILFKGKGKRSEANNYRAISLINDFRRIYERFIDSRIEMWSDSHNATGKMQFGFKKATSTLDAIFILRSFLLYATRILLRPAFSVFMDLKKAFPSTSRVKTLETVV